MRDRTLHAVLYQPAFESLKPNQSNPTIFIKEYSSYLFYKILRSKPNLFIFIIKFSSFAIFMNDEVIRETETHITGLNSGKSSYAN